MTDQISLSWTRPLDLGANTEAREEAKGLRDVATTVLNLRLSERAQGAGAAFSIAGMGTAEVAGSAEQTSIRIIPAPGKWREALAAVVTEQRLLAQDGITAADLSRAIAAIRPRLQAAADAASTRTDRAVADGIVAATIVDEVSMSPAQNLDLFNRVVARTTPEAVTTAFRRAFTGAGPLVFRSTTNAASGDDPALAAAVTRSFAAPQPAGASSTMVAWPYASFGPFGQVVERNGPDAAGATTVRFANGTRLAVRPHLLLLPGGVSVRVAFGNGLVSLHPEQAHAAWLLTSGAPGWVQGGTVRLPWVQVQRAIEGHNVSLALAAEDTRFVMSGGSSRRAELPFQMKLLAAYFTHAAYRPRQSLG